MGSEKFHLRIDETWANALLSTPDQSGKTIASKLTEARDNLAKAVEEARQTLLSNPLTHVVATAKAREAGLKGTATILVEDDGQVVLCPESVPALTKGKWSSDLPPLPTLRREAASLGLNVSELGRNKRLILKAIQEARAAPPRRKMMRTSVAVSQPQVVTLPGDAPVVSLVPALIGG